MSTFAVPIVKLGKIEKHANADTLSITEVDGYPVIVRNGEFQEGDLAVYIPVEAVVPTKGTVWEFLATKELQTTHRLKAKRLRGVFSMGLLTPAKALFADVPEVGTDVAAMLGIIKYEEPEYYKGGQGGMNLGSGETESGSQSISPVYTDIETFRKPSFRAELVDGERVVATEKLHGCNGRFVVRQMKDDAAPRLYVGSHRFYKRESETSVWWKVAKQLDLATKLAAHPDMVLFGEVYGMVQDLHYGATTEDPLRFRAFDVLDLKTNKYLDYDAFVAFCAELGIERVPVLYDGPYDYEKLVPLAVGKSTLGDNVREGFVIRPAVERFSYKLGRTILKFVGEDYLLRKGGTEYH